MFHFYEWISYAHIFFHSVVDFCYHSSMVFIRFHLSVVGLMSLKIIFAILLCGQNWMLYYAQCKPIYTMRARNAWCMLHIYIIAIFAVVPAKHHVFTTNSCIPIVPILILFLHVCILYICIILKINCSHILNYNLWIIIMQSNEIFCRKAKRKHE